MTRAMRLSLRDFLRQLGRARQGAAAVEMAFIAPILIFLAAGLIDFGTGVYTKMMVADAAQAGAAYAQLNAGSFTSATCTSNTSPVCGWDTSVVAAATAAHSNATLFSTAVSASAIVMSCCLAANGSVDLPNCTQPPAAAPVCTPAAGTYTSVTTSASLTTLLPYKYAGEAFNFTIPSPITMTANYLVRVN